MRSGFGDVAISAGVPLSESSHMSQRIVFTVELPIGKEQSLHGSGGFDAGLRWFAARTGPRHHWLFGTGVTYQDPSGSFFGFERPVTVHFSADYIRPITSRTAFHAAARLDSSPLDGVTETNLADPVLFYRFGIRRLTRAGQWLTFDLGEEIAPQMGVDTDFSLHLGYGWHIGVPRPQRQNVAGEESAKR